ncbi:MAG TPA: phage Gp37/Gp68 family protein [Aurantimonas coralicida]|uniref:Phage Gp37/Gp68 family protein n=1 Tax=Aurantimonas coralicida TaxID=182270 RepID=A0A9C9NFZ5_9HYPH|nr:phage Gp37/Gp68 family protein [Aurantimonas coralicida]
MGSKIEWTDDTWNPVTGCTKVSPGCAHCYAERVAARLWPTQYPPVEFTYHDPTISSQVSDLRVRKFIDVQVHPDRLDQPLRWTRPRRIFVCSMSDLFHEDVPDEFIDQVFAVMALSPRHTFQVLTKRAERMLQWFEDSGRSAVEATMLYPQFKRWRTPSYCANWPLPNVWLGVSVENQATADERIPLLLETPAALRFLSCEPLLGPIDLKNVKDGTVDALDGIDFEDVGDIRTTEWPTSSRFGDVDWVIVGGESGPKARRCRVDWVEGLIRQCREASVPCFVKQLGADPRTSIDQVPDFAPLVSHRGSDPDEWPPELRVREYPAEKAVTPSKASATLAG